MASNEFVTLDGYVVVAQTVLAIGVVKTVKSTAASPPLPSPSDVSAWIPRSVCDDGEVVGVGDTDLSVREWFADKEGLDY